MGNEDKQDGSGERDTRFDVFRKNPIYRRVPKNQKRVQIDSRFKSMFHDEQFKLTYKVDKRGRPVNTTTNENLKKYYELEEEDGEEGNISDSKLSKSESVKSDQDEEAVKVEPDEDDSDSKGSESDESKEDDDDETNIEGNISEAQIRKKDKSVKITKDIKKKLHDAEVDYARGEAEFASEESESDDSSSSEDEEDVADISHAWGELDRDAERVENSTSRLALCNMDWDRVKAVDLMVLFHSFLPSNGLLKSVTIYPSEFGKERLAEEEVHGPRELRVEKAVNFPEEVENGSDDSEEDDEMAPGDEEDEEGGSYHMEKLRQYQLNRLKYYYALLEFDSAETAEKVYTECDGMEYESSATHVDLRFVPDDMEFDENDVKDRCDKLADGEKYRPRFFTTTALQQAKVDLTWDETDPMRKELTERVFNPKDEIDDEDLKAYLASSSESEDEIVNENDADGSGAENDTASNADPMAKYRALLEGIEDSEKKKKERDVEMEITWGVGLKTKTEKMVKEKLEKQAAANLTPWEEILAKKKEKSKKKRHDKRKGTGTGTEEVGSGSDDDEDEDQPFSDDDVDVDLNDPFFEEELKTKTKKSSKQKSNKKDEIIPKPGEKPADKAALELLLMDDEDHKHHFNLKNIIDRETDSKSKKKRLKKKDLKNKVQKKDTVDNFELDVADDRFSALFSSHLFNVDPSDPNYKNTNAMKTIVSEKQKRRLAAVSADEVSKNEKNLDTSQEQSEAKKSKTSAELSVLVKSIKRNTDNLKNRHKNKPKQW